MSRLLVVIPSNGGFGGVETFVFSLIDALRGGGAVEPSLCLRRWGQYEPGAALREAIEISGVEVHTVGRMSPDLWRLVRRSEVVHSQNCPGDVAVVARVLGVPHITTVHGWARPTRGRAARHIMMRLADRRLYNSDFVAATWEGFARANDRDRLPIASRMTRQPIAPERRRGFVFASRWIPGKGVEILVEAYRLAALDPVEHPLTLLGDGPLRARVSQLLADHDIAGIEMPGWVSPDERDDRLRHARWLVACPTEVEDLGLTPLEARSAGVPAIVTRIGGLLEAAGTYSLSCRPNDPEALAGLLCLGADMDAATYTGFSSASAAELDRELQPLAVYEDMYENLVRNAR